MGTASLAHCPGAQTKPPTVREDGRAFPSAFPGSFRLPDPQSRFSSFRAGMDSGLEGGREGSQKALTERTKSPDQTLPRGAQRSHPAAFTLLQPRWDPAAPGDALPALSLPEPPGMLSRLRSYPKSPGMLPPAPYRSEPPGDALPALLISENPGDAPPSSLPA